MISRVFKAAAQPAGVPAKVLPPVALGLSPRMSSLAENPANGSIPPERCLPTTIMSGTTPECSTAQNGPVRPTPVNTSSAIKSQPRRSQIARISFKKEVRGIQLPPSASAGSTRTAAILSGDITYFGIWCSRCQRQ